MLDFLASDHSPLCFCFAPLSVWGDLSSAKWRLLPLLLDLRNLEKAKIWQGTKAKSESNNKGRFIFFLLPCLESIAKKCFSFKEVLRKYKTILSKILFLVWSWTSHLKLFLDEIVFYLHRTSLNEKLWIVRQLRYWLFYLSYLLSYFESKISEIQEFFMEKHHI